MAEQDDIATVEMPPLVLRIPPPDRPMPPPDRPMPAGGARRVRWPVALVVAWAALAVADIVILHSTLDSRPASATTRAVTPSVNAHRHTGARAPLHPVPAIAHNAWAAARPTSPARLLVPISASAVGPFGPGSGNNPQRASLAIDASTATAWVTDWYRTAQFGGLQPGTGLLIDMDHRVRITSVQIVLGSARGADLQLLTGNVPALASLRLRASASDAGGTLQLKLASSKRARYLLIWFTSLPPDSSGTFQASVYKVRVKGTP